MPVEGYTQKTIYIDHNFLKDIKVRIVTSNEGPANISELVRFVWGEYLERDFELVGYRNLVGDHYQSKTSEMESKISPLIPEDMITKIDLRLLENQIKYKNDRDLSKLTHVTLELIQRLYLDVEE